MSSALFTPLKVGAAQLQHRIAMAPLTRFRATDEHVILPFVAEYYAQRASVPGTLIVSEATLIAPRGSGYQNSPGIWSQEQINAWKPIVDAVHAKKSYIYLQIVAMGRAASPDVLAREAEPGLKVKGPSPIAFEGGAQPEELTETEIEEYITLFTQAAKNGIEAGFDGIELHGANGYLLDQFLQDVSNQRTDAWGGSVEKRARLPLEVTKSVVAAIGAERTSYRVSPYSEFQGMHMKDPKPQFNYLAEELKKLKLAYLHIIEGRISGNDDKTVYESIDWLVNTWNNVSPVMLAGGYKQANAKKAVDEDYKGKDIIIAFGRHYISNPDLPFRVKEGIEFTPYDRNMFYLAKQEKGYTTYAFSKEFEAYQARIGLPN